MLTTAGPRNMLRENYVPTPFNTLGDVYQPQSSNVGPDELMWMDLAAPGAAPVGAMGQATEELAVAIATGKGNIWGVVRRAGDTASANTPDWSHDGQTIAYTSTDSVLDGHVGGGGIAGSRDPSRVDIYTVPFGNGGGGTATPVLGASDPIAAEYYPDYSADDRFIAFNRVPQVRQLSPQAPSPGYVFYRQDADIHIVPSAGGNPIRLAANDSPVCQGNHPAGQLNSWAKWAPLVRTVEGAKYYWLIFSSARASTFNVSGNTQYAVVDTRASQLYMTGVVENPDGSIETYPAVYLWNQENLANGAGADATVIPLATSNLTPAWDEFVVPVVTVEIVLR
jgi:hypothetical protein